MVVAVALRSPSLSPLLLFPAPLLEGLSFGARLYFHGLSESEAVLFEAAARRPPRGGGAA